jgi:hypothetical protein
MSTQSRSSSVSFHFDHPRCETKMPRSPMQSTAKPVQMDQKGKIASWNGQSDDAFDLKLFVENGRLNGMTAKQVMAKYTQFNKYAYSTFNSALRNAQKVFKNTVMGRGAPPGLNRKLLHLLYCRSCVRYAYFNDFVVFSLSSTLLLATTIQTTATVALRRMRMRIWMRTTR